jgi:membrane protein implicated in regulation of membrane protease activity
MIVFTLATAGVVLIVAALATESWWLLPVALLAHAAATAVTVVAIKRTAAQKEKPDPVTEARLEEEHKESSGHGESGRGDGGEPRTVI